MSIKIYPIAFLHKITVDTYYRKLRTRIIAWRSNTTDNLFQMRIFINWKLFNKANKNLRQNIFELTRIISVIKLNNTTITPDIAKNLTLH